MPQRIYLSGLHQLSEQGARVRDSGVRMALALSIDEEGRDLETIQVEDIPFELVEPNIARALSPKPSSDSLPTRAQDTSLQQPSPIKPDAPGMFLRPKVLRTMA
jgi:hypothetical protein